MESYGIKFHFGELEVADNSNMTGEVKSESENNRDSISNSNSNNSQSNNNNNLTEIEDGAAVVVVQTDGSSASLNAIPSNSNVNSVVTISTQDLSSNTADNMNGNNNNNRIFPLRLNFMERGQRNWSDWRNSMFQEFRPLVQNSQNSSNSILATLIPHSNRNRSHDLGAQPIRDVNTSSDSVVINMDQHPSPSSRDLSLISNSVALNSTNDVAFDRQNSGNFIIRSHSQSQISLHHEPTGRSQSIHSSGNLSNSVNADSNGNTNNNGPNPNSDSTPETLTQIPEAREFINTVCRYMPYVAIIAVKSCYDHLDGILYIFALFITFLHSNFVVRQEVSKKVILIILMKFEEFNQIRVHTSILFKNN